MRLLEVKCILLACMASTLVAHDARPKRDLQFWKDLLAAKLGLTPKPQKEESVQILRIPGFNQVLVKAVPKVTVVESPVPERIVQLDPTTAILGSYLGTRTPEETIFALKGTHQLLQSGVLTAARDFAELVPHEPPAYVLPPKIIQQRLDWPEQRPIYPAFEQNVVQMPSRVFRPMQSLPPVPQVPVLPPVRSFPVFSQVPVLPPVPVLQPPPPQRLIPMPPPTIVVPEIKPLPLPPPLVPVIPLVPTTYSYKKINADGSVTSYISKGSQDVIVTETSKPPPPPPSYIFDRFQKIVYGMPLGSPVPVSPTFVRPSTHSDVNYGPFPEPVMPVIMEPSTVDVKVSHVNKNKHFGSLGIYEAPRLFGKPQTSTVIQEEFVVPRPLVMPSSPQSLIETTEADSIDRYNHIHKEGSITSSTGTYSMKEQPEYVYFDHISKLPPPPPELLKRIEAVSGKPYNSKSLWGYSVKMSNGAGSFENFKGDKIYYSHLESPSEKDPPLFPDPLSSLTDNEPDSPNNNWFTVPNDDNRDEMGYPFISTKIKGETLTEDRPGPDRSDITPIKKYPALPMPIAGENEKKIGAAKYSYTITNNPNSSDGTKFTFSTETPISGNELSKHHDYNRYGSDGFSYTQVNHDGTVDTFTGSKKYTTAAITGENISTQPVEVIQPTSKPNVANTLEPHYSYTQVDKQGVATTITEDNNVNIPAPVLVEETVKVPLRSETVACVHRKPCIPKATPVTVLVSGQNSPGYSYTQINNAVGSTKIKEDDKMKVPVVAEIPVRPVAIVDVLEPIKKQSHGFSYTQINNVGGITEMTGDGKVVEDVRASVLPEVNIVATPHAEKQTSRYSYTQINNGGGLTKFTGNGLVELPVEPADIVDVVEPFPLPSPVTVEVKEKNPMFTQPVLSNYVYKQISHHSPQPFTVVQVDNNPKVEVPLGEVQVKVNKHWHRGVDGIEYPCTEVHPIPAQDAPTDDVTSAVPKDYVYVPPLNSETPLPALNKVEINNTGSYFSYTQISSSSTEALATTVADTESEQASTVEPTSFSQQHPIVVAPVDSNYSYTQKNSDGSSLNVQGEKDNMVSVTVEANETQGSEIHRGDIPDASS